MKQNYQMKIFLCLELLLYQLQFKLLAFSPRTHHEFAKLCNLLFLCDLLNGTRPDLLHGLMLLQTLVEVIDTVCWPTCPTGQHAPVSPI